MKPDTVDPRTGSRVRGANPLENLMIPSSLPRDLVRRVAVLAAFTCLGLGTAGCPHVVAGLGALSPAQEQHEERWVPPGTGVGRNRPEPGECVSVHPAIVWGERSTPASTPLDPIDVVDLEMAITTPEVCELIPLEGGHAYRIKGKLEGSCGVATSYTHPVTAKVVEEMWSLEFAREVAPPPPAPMTERPEVWSCDRPVTSDPYGVTRPKAAAAAPAE